METPQKPTVLIVDDEELVRMAGSEILKDGGYQVREAANAAEALSCLEGGVEIMVLFTDINMPGSPDGLGLAQVVHDRWPDVKIVVASGRGRPSRDQIPDDGRFLSKPYRAEELLVLIERLTQP